MWVSGDGWRFELILQENVRKKERKKARESEKGYGKKEEIRFFSRTS
jgi:hypothetical protein